jgi:hypothetical protein
MRVRFLSLSLPFLCALSPTVASAQDLDPKEVRISLQQALPIAIAKAEAEFPDLDDYILYSVHPRAFKGDPRGLALGVCLESQGISTPESSHRSGLHERRLSHGRTRAGCRSAMS